MRTLVLLTLMTAAAAACRDATAPGGTAGNPAFSEASDAAHLDLREERASLATASNAVSDAIVAQGVVAGLGGALAGDALVLVPRENVIQGRAEAVAFFGTPAAPLGFHWEVLVTQVSNDGTQGYTWAQGGFTVDLGAGPVERPGLFLIYWRRGGAGGDWEIAAFVFNTGGPLDAPIPAGFGTPGNKHRRHFPNTEVSEQRDAILAVDAAFSATSVSQGSGPAFEQFAAPNAIAVGGPQFVYGPAAIGEAFSSEPDDVISWVPRFADVAPSGDLGFSVGDATFDLPAFGMFFSKYVTVWQKQDTGAWRYVADLGNSRPAP